MITGIEPLTPENEQGRYLVRVWAVSDVSNNESTRDMEIALADWHDYLKGKTIQDAFPYLSADDREFLLTGITPEEWDAIFGEGE